MDYLVNQYCNMLIEVATECKEGKRNLNECIDLIDKFSTNLQEFKDSTICACGKKHPRVAEFGACGACMNKRVSIP